MIQWSDDRVEKLKSLWQEGLSASQVAHALGDVTRNAVIGKVHRLGLAGRDSEPRKPAASACKTAPNASLPRANPNGGGGTAVHIRRRKLRDHAHSRQKHVPLAPW